MKAVEKIKDVVRNLATGISYTLDELRSGVPADPIPADWDKKVLKSREMYYTIGAVKKSVSTWLALVLGDGIRIEAVGDKEATKTLKKFVRRINLDLALQEAFLQFCLAGEGVCAKARKSGKITRLRSMNPLSIEPTWTEGILTGVQQYPVDKDNKVNRTGTLKNIPNQKIEDIYFMRHDGPEWEKHGFPITLPAFELVDILADLRKADKATAKRWSSLLRIITLGGVFGNKFVNPTDAYLAKWKKLLDEQDQNKGLVGPWHLKVNDYGGEGIALNTAERTKLLTEEIAQAILLFPVFLTGTAGDFATAKSLLKVLKYQIHGFRLILRGMLDWFFSPDELEKMGLNPELELEYSFDTFDIDTENDEKKIMMQLYELSGLSRETIQRLFGFDPETEAKQLESQPAPAGKPLSAQDIVAMVQNGIIKAKEGKTLIENIYKMNLGSTTGKPDQNMQ